MTKVKGNTQELSETSKKADKPEKKERCSYSVDQKQIVVEYALKHAKFPIVDNIIKEIKADDAMQRLSRSQNEEFNNEYMVESEVEDEGNQIEKINEKTNEEPVTEIHEIFDKYMFTEADPLVASSSFIPSTMHPDHTQNHVQPKLKSIRISRRVITTFKIDILPFMLKSSSNVRQYYNRKVFLVIVGAIEYVRRIHKYPGH
ncbi:14641_t:CDS:2 [Funneliformis geosporum]|uniref:14641_t:CDS:1 n=1 Tax=Funneliformis geosporum TaxID=1117311 RepID=A0A9W4WZ65_9GLOM|nr:14641_t:CDS:2 [Funneliformis geosporum]